MRTVRIFVSSPGDAAGERKRVGRVVARLNAAFRDSVRLEALRWEERFYSAHDGFQPQIPRAGECDVVVAILRGRLGTPLPPGFAESLPPEERLPAGESYPSGTAYEILSAIRARREGLRGELPDIYVFRWPSPPQITLDAPDRAEVEAQWAALKRFAEEVFVTREGQFRGAYQTYASLDDFERQAEALLRGWLDAHVFASLRGGRAVPWPVATRGSPFRGLEAFGAKHAEVFFGRGREVARAVEVLRAAAVTGLPFLTVVGPSGAGKSSFVRAGLVPRLTGPGEIEGVGAWRVALVRPGENPDGPAAALALALFAGAADLPEAEAGGLPALPELAEGAFPTPEALTRQLGHADETAAAPLLAALARVADAERARWGAERPEAARLLLVLDQLEEIFSVSVTDAQRAGFARLVEALGRSGAVFVVATLRAEFYEVFLKSPLAQLAGDERTLTLKAPGLPEMAEIVREPARAAGLAWETDPVTGESLDARLLADIDRPDLLPLLQFVLDRLFEAREGAEGEPGRLTFAAYARLGTLDGAIRSEAERAFAGLDPAAQAALPRLLRGLVVPARAGAGESAAVAPVPARLDAVAPGEAARRLAARLTDARILVGSHGPDGAPMIGLAHQRVIEAWDRARVIVAESAAFRRVREGLALRRRDWEAAGRPADLLLARGVLLAQAETLAADYPDEIPADDLAYLAASRRRADRALRRATALAGLFAAVALAALGAGLLAYREAQRAEAQRQAAEAQRLRAERSLALTRSTVDQVLFQIAQGLRNVEGVRVSTINRILASVETAMRHLAQEAPEDNAILRSRGVMLTEFGNTYLAAGDGAMAVAVYEAGNAVARALIAREPGLALHRRDLSVGLNRLGEARRRAGDTGGALKAYAESLDLARGLAADDPADALARRDLATVLEAIGVLRLRGGEAPAAMAAFAEALALRRALAGADAGGTQGGTQGGALSDDAAGARHDLAIGLINLGEARARTGDAAGGRAAYDEALTILRALAERDPDDASAQRDLSLSLGRVGDARLATGDADGARAVYEAQLRIVRALAGRDPGNADWQRDLSVSLNKLGDVALRAGDGPGALKAYEEGLAIRRALAARDPGNAEWRRDVAVGLFRLGDARLRTGAAPAARAAYEEALGLLRPLASQDPGNAELQHDLVVGLSQLGDVRLGAGETEPARAAYEEALGLARPLVQRDAGNVQWQRDLAVLLNKLGDMRARAGETEGARTAYDEGLALVRALRARDPGNVLWRTDLVLTLVRLGAVSPETDRKRALLREALDLAEALAREGRLAAAYRDWPDSLRKGLEALGPDAAGSGAAGSDAAGSGSGTP